jgi:alkylresorcinol/alkylpyrone synthase
MKIASVASALPPHYYDQRAVTARLERIWKDHPHVLRRLPALYESCGVEGRHFALPIERYEELSGFGQFNDEWIRVALELGERAIVRALERAGLERGEVDAIFFSSVTGVCAPSLDARLANRLGLRSDLRRVPIFGLGCVAGAAAVSRAADFLRGRPDGVALVLTVELCSLTWQREDTSLAHVISCGLFGDGATCAVVVGAERRAAGPRIVDTRSVFYPDTEDVMGWRVSERGFSIVLSPAVPSVARERLGPDCDAFLAPHGLSRADVSFWVCHPGGPKVLAASRDSLEITDADLELSWESLRRFGNLSSASVLLILEQTLARRAPAPGSLGVMLAMGPGFCSEFLLLRQE